MSATLIPCLPYFNNTKKSLLRGAICRRFARVIPGWSQRVRTPRDPMAGSGADRYREIPGSLRCTRAPECRGARLLMQDFALDLGGPGLFDQLDHGVGHRNVVEFLGHLVALLESPFKELDGFLCGGFIGRVLVH